LTATITESARSTSDLAVIDAIESDRRYRRRNTEAVTATVGAPSARPCIPPLAAVGCETCAKPELGARFKRDAIPLLEPLYRRALRMTNSPADAEDLLQDTMLRAYSNFGSFRDGSNINAWLHVILRNTYINGYRKRLRQPEQYPTDEISDHQLAAIAEHSSTGLRTAEDEALTRLPDTRIRAAMLALPEEYRMTVYYADVAGFRYREIAEIMDAPKGTVMSRLHRGRRQLRNLLADTIGDSCPDAVPEREASRRAGGGGAPQR
jgi:RNA polymerase sigma-70 factor (ECF subfamily)